LALILFDLDQLKMVNDSYGHQAGDVVLQRLGELLQQRIRSIDIVCRYGGDEFCVVMPEADAVICRQFMRRLRSDLEQTAIPISGTSTTIHCTISLGGAIYPQHGEDPDQLFHAADMALLQAKGAGRNLAVVHGDEESVAS
jgi:diguanylate cyclase (GGDEF)-like protein